MGFYRYRFKTMGKIRYAEIPVSNRYFMRLCHDIGKKRYSICVNYG